MHQTEQTSRATRKAGLPNRRISWSDLQEAGPVGSKSTLVCTKGSSIPEKHSIYPNVLQPHPTGGTTEKVAPEPALRNNNKEQSRPERSVWRTKARVKMAVKASMVKECGWLVGLVGKR
jgi:hypothetical protein